jgi:hypothetical protein
VLQDVRPILALGSYISLRQTIVDHGTHCPEIGSIHFVCRNGESSLIWLHGVIRNQIHGSNYNVAVNWTGLFTSSGLTLVCALRAVPQTPSQIESKTTIR